MKTDEKEESWQPKSQLDHELIAVGKAFFAGEPCDCRINWAITAHCHTRWLQRFGSAPTCTPTSHPINDLRNPRLRQATAKEVDKILANCAGHAGEASRGTHYFILPDPVGGIRDRVFVAALMDSTSRRYNRYADANMVAITCFAYIRTTGAARRVGAGHQKQLRLKRS